MTKTADEQWALELADRLAPDPARTSAETLAAIGGRLNLLTAAVEEATRWKRTIRLRVRSLPTCCELHVGDRKLVFEFFDGLLTATEHVYKPQEAEHNPRETVRQPLNRPPPGLPIRPDNAHSVIGADQVEAVVLVARAFVESVLMSSP